MNYEDKWDDPNYVFEYDETAKCCLRWKSRKTRKSLIGKECGTFSKTYSQWRVKYNGKSRLVNRVIWEMFYGSLGKEDVVKFIDGDSNNVKVSNLTVEKFEGKNWQDKYIREGDLHKALDYYDGKLYWKGDRYKGVRLHIRYAADGDEVYTRTGTDGYLYTRIISYRKSYVGIHRLIYEYFYGRIAEGMEIDHIDGNPLNNRVENLRCVNRATNCRNIKIGKLNRTGVLGVAELRDGKGEVVGHASTWTDLDGSKKYKEFKITIHGRNTLELAIKSREDAISKLNEILGDEGYHENHGKRA